jgi:hypothetical protein
VRKTAQLRRDANKLARAAAVLRRHQAALVDKTPMAEVHEGKRGPHGRRLYTWSLEILGWAAAVLRAVPPSQGRIQETELLTAALALQHAGLRVREIGVLLVSAGMSSYIDADDERTKGWLARARRNKNVRAAAHRLADFVRAQNAPANVPATTKNRPTTAQRHPKRK